MSQPDRKFTLMASRRKARSHGERTSVLKKTIEEKFDGIFKREFQGEIYAIEWNLKMSVKFLKISFKLF